jgi:uncharacterized protein (TIGR02145 family)
MKYSRFFLLVFFAGISLTGCQKNEDTPGNTPEELLFKGYELLDSGYSEFYEFAAKNNGNAPLALYETAKWIFEKGIAQDVYIVDSTYMYIMMSDDITMLMRLNYVDENGNSFFRGGLKSGNSLLGLLNDNSCSNAIPNNKVLLWGAADDLSINYTNIKNILSESDFEFEVTELMHEECTPSTLETLNQYGLVLLGTHGAPDFIMTGSVIDLFKGKPKNLKDFKEKILASVGQEGYDDFISGELILGEDLFGGRLEPEMTNEEWWKDMDENTLLGVYEVWATMDYLERLPNLTNTIIFNNSCYSGATVKKVAHGNINGIPVNVILTETIGNAFLGRNPIAYYGWTHDDLTAGPIENETAIEAEVNFFTRLADSADSTGIAHKKADGSLFEFSYPPRYPEILRLKQFNNDSFCYQDSCGVTLIDPRDGQEYTTVCIGEQVWMAENLNFETDNSWCYDNDPANCETYGRLYNSESVKTACPPGWHLPSVEEYEELRNNFPVDIAGGELKSVTGWNEPNAGATNNSGWSALPGGFSNPLVGSYTGLGLYGYWWTSTTLFVSNADRTRDVSLSANHSRLGISTNGPVDGSAGYSCRCVKDD